MTADQNARDGGEAGMNARLEHTAGLMTAVEFLLRNHEGLASDVLVTELELFRDYVDLIRLADEGIPAHGAAGGELVLVRHVPVLPSQAAQALRTLNDAGLIVRVPRRGSARPPARAGLDTVRAGPE